MSRHQPSTSFPAYVQEDAFAALENIDDQIDRFLRAIANDLGAALGVGQWNPEAAGELAYLRETITEHLRGQLPEAFEAAAEWSDRDPMAAPAQKVAA